MCRFKKHVESVGRGTTKSRACGEKKEGHGAEGRGGGSEWMQERWNGVKTVGGGRGEEYEKREAWFAQGKVEGEKPS